MNYLDIYTRRAILLRRWNTFNNSRVRYGQLLAYPNSYLGTFPKNPVIASSIYLRAARLVLKRVIMLLSSGPGPNLREKTPNFETLLPNTRDPVKTKFRSKLVYVLNSQGEILPPANSLMGKLWRLVNSPDASTQDCQELIELDPTLTARIFRVANSAAYGLKASPFPRPFLIWASKPCGKWFLMPPFFPN